MRRPVWQGIQWVLGLLIVAFMLRYVARNWSEIQTAPLRWELSWPVLVLALVLVWAAFASLADAWRRMVEGWGYPLSWLDGARIWLLSSMAKYVPGKVWALAGMALMAERRGIPAWSAAGSAVILQLVSLGTGAVIVATTGLAVGNILPGPLVLAGFAAAMGLLVSLVLWPPLTRRAIAAFAPAADLATVPGPRPLLFGVLANLGAWIGYGTAFWLFARGTLPDAHLGMGEAIGVYTASYVAGVVAPFAPGGLGVRESVMVLALQGQLGLASALALAAVARLGMTAGEVLAAVPFLIRTGERSRD